MLVSDVIEDIKYGELSSLALKSNDAAIISYINMGMLELYKRFSLRSEEAIVSLDAYSTIYLIDPSNPKVDMPTSGSMMHIVAVYDEYGEYVGLNNEDDPDSVLTVSFDTIQVPNPADGTYLSLIYASSPTRITSVTDTIRLPMSLYEALLHYVGYRAAITLEAGVDKENNAHYIRFEKSCNTAREFGLTSADEIPYRPVNFKGFM